MHRLAAWDHNIWLPCEPWCVLLASTAITTRSFPQEDIITPINPRTLKAKYPATRHLPAATITIPSKATLYTL